MIISLKKFGDILSSREAGREARAAFLPTLRSLSVDEGVKIDFQGVSVLTPSWADEFIRPLIKEYGNKVSYVNADNPSVQSALEFADPKLDLSKVTVFADKLVFDEKQNYGKCSDGSSWLILTFPYSDDDAVKLLQNNTISSIRLMPVDKLNPTRLENVKKLFKEAGIESIV